jgi:hypothetical protein
MERLVQGQSMGIIQGVRACVVERFEGSGRRGGECLGVKEKTFFWVLCFCSFLPVRRKRGTLAA